MDSLFAKDPITLLLAILGGIVPALIWLKFWLKEDKEQPEPTGLLALTFLAGMLAVILVLPLQKLLLTTSTDQNTLIVLWAASEEILKFLAVVAIAYSSSYINSPVDYPIFYITAALGFAGLENALFLIHPVTVSDTTVSLLTGNLRFLGSTLLHATATGFMGIAIGLAFFRSKQIKVLSLIVGLIIAIALHSVFNFLIMKNNGDNFLQVFAFLWVAAIINLLIFEKLRRMSEPLYLKEVTIHGTSNPSLINN